MSSAAGCPPRMRGNGGTRLTAPELRSHAPAHVAAPFSVRARRPGTPTIDVDPIVSTPRRRQRAERWETQSAVTVVADVSSDQREAVGALLAVMGLRPADNRVMPLGAIDGVHFARVYLTDATVAPDGAEIDSHLIYMSDFDGSVDAHLERLVDVSAGGIDELFGHCIGYPPGRPADRRARLAYLRRHLVSTGVTYVNTIGRTVDQVRAEAALHDAIEDYLDLKLKSFEAVDARSVRNDVRTFVSTDAALSWALVPAAAPPLGYRLKATARFLGPLLGALVTLPILLLGGLVWLVVLRIHETRDPAPPTRPTERHLAQLRALEDHTSQNQFTVIGFIKRGWFRRATTRMVLRLIGYGARHLFHSGSLAGVKTIHFARWVPLDGRRRVVFCSNYDGSTESYMDDFIDKVAWGLNAAFSSGVGYPKTRWLVLGGAKDEEAFKGILRSLQIPTQVWFSAYDRLTALNIGNNARVRSGLSGEMTETEAQAWLRLL